jgi:hypothetical protein
MDVPQDASTAAGLIEVPCTAAGKQSPVTAGSASHTLKQSSPTNSAWFVFSDQAEYRAQSGDDMSACDGQRALTLLQGVCLAPR